MNKGSKNQDLAISGKVGAHSQNIKQWSAEENEVFRTIDRASQWNEAESLFYTWFNTLDDPEKRIAAARWARKNFWARLMRMGSINKPTFKAVYADLKEQMDISIARDRKFLEEQEHALSNSDSASSVRKIQVVSKFAHVVRIFEAMKQARIITDQTPDKQIVDHCFVEGSTAKNLQANLAATRKSVREGSKARSKEMLAFMKILGRQLSPSDRDELIASLQRRDA